MKIIKYIIGLSFLFAVLIISAAKFGEGKFIPKSFTNAPMDTVYSSQNQSNSISTDNNYIFTPNNINYSQKINDNSYSNLNALFYKRLLSHLSLKNNGNIKFPSKGIYSRNYYVITLREIII